MQQTLFLLIMCLFFNYVCSLPVYYTEFEIKNTTLSQTEIPQIIADFIAVFVDDVISVQNISVSST